MRRYITAAQGWGGAGPEQITMALWHVDQAWKNAIHNFPRHQFMMHKRAAAAFPVGNAAAAGAFAALQANTAAALAVAGSLHLPDQFTLHVYGNPSL